MLMNAVLISVLQINSWPSIQTIDTPTQLFWVSMFKHTILKGYRQNRKKSTTKRPFGTCTCCKLFENCCKTTNCAETIIGTSMNLKKAAIVFHITHLKLQKWRLWKNICTFDEKYLLTGMTWQLRLLLLKMMIDEYRTKFSWKIKMISFKMMNIELETYF